MARQTISQRDALRRLSIFDREREAMAALVDVSLSRGESFAKFERLARRLPPKVAGFYLYIAAAARARKEDQRFDADQFSRWSDDGGRA